MGYACPVCDAPQVDAEHLANHLAVTATVHGEAHAAWLDTHAPDWQDGGPNDLAPRVVEHAESIDVPTVFEPDPGSVDRPRTAPLPDDDRDEVVREALDRARDLLDETGEE